MIVYSMILSFMTNKRAPFKPPKSPFFHKYILNSCSNVCYHYICENSLLFSVSAMKNLYRHDIEQLCVIFIVFVCREADRKTDIVVQHLIFETFIGLIIDAQKIENGT